MNEQYLEHIQNLHALFETSFMEAYLDANPRKRRNALPYLQAIYRRWYYSTMIENTPLSPANILESMCLHYNMPSATYTVAHGRGKTKLMGIDMQLVEYSLDNHPIIGDFHRFIEYCTPHIDLLEGEAFTSAQAMELGAMLSLNDPHYAAFMLEVSLWMKLIVKVPSIGVNRLKSAPDAAQILAGADIFREIVDTTIAIASRGLQNLVMLPETLFTPSFIRSLLTAPMDTDDIFSRIYEVLGYDLEDLLDMTMEMDEGDELEETDVDLLAGTFMTGIFLDKFFFAPFGHFLKLIRPLYVLPFDFKGEIADYVKVSGDPEESLIAFFAPCSSYTLTDLGLECFGVAKTEDNYIDAAKLIPFKEMKNTIFSSKEALHIFVEIARHLGPLHHEALGPEEVFTFRVRLEDDKSVWVHLQMPTGATLHDMYIEAAEYFALKDNNDYTFYHDKKENRFAEYTAPKRSKGGKKTSETRLCDLDFQHQKEMLLVAYNQSIPFGEEDPTVCLQLEMLHKKPADLYHEYPRVSRVSKGYESKKEW